MGSRIASSVWQAGMDFVVELYRELENFPAREQFGLTAQLRRAAVSIPSNIAEGAGKKKYQRARPISVHC
jgi:four helix bundle protein